MAWLSRLRTTASQLRPARLVATTRAYGSAAALELDYDYDYEYDYELDRRPAYPRVNTAGSAPERGVHWVLIGDPGAKRHVYAEKLSKILEVPHISMGSLIRQELTPCSSLYKQIADALNEGKLVPEDVTFALLSKRLEEGYYRGENGFILDGIPRTRMQAEILDQMADIDLVVNFKSTDEILVKKSPGSETLLSMAKSSDGRSALKERANIYSEQGKALEEYYRKQSKLLNFQVAGAPGDTWQGLLAALHLQHKNALTSSQKLTV